MSSADKPSSSIPTALAKSRKDSATFLDFNSPPASPSAPIHDSPKSAEQQLPLTSSPEDSQMTSSTNVSSSGQDKPQRSYTPSPTTKSKVYQRGDYMDDEQSPSRRESSTSTKASQAPSTVASKIIERSETPRSSTITVTRGGYSRSVSMSHTILVSAPSDVLYRPPLRLHRRRTSRACPSASPTWRPDTTPQPQGHRPVILPRCGRQTHRVRRVKCDHKA